MAYKYLLNETPHCMGWCGSVMRCGASTSLYGKLGSVMRCGGSSSLYGKGRLSDEVWWLIKEMRLLIVRNGMSQ